MSQNNKPKYNILWLDDDQSIIEDWFEDDFPELSFTQICYKNKFNAELETNSAFYDAFILDANGIDEDGQKADKTGFLKLVRKAKALKPTYIYSGQINTDATEDTTHESLENDGFEDNKTLFYKSIGPNKLLNQICKDLDHNYQYYVGNEYLLDFFRKEWIEEKHKSLMDQLMKWYSANEVQASYGNPMRQMLESMLWRINEKFALGVNGIPGDCTGWSGRVIKTIESTDKFDDKQFIIGFLYHIANFSNAQSHASIGEDERELYFKANFSTFFGVTTWFHKLMLNFNDTPSSQHAPMSETSKSSKKSIEEKIHKENGTAYVKIKIPPKLAYKDKLRIKQIVPDVNKKGQWYIKI